VDAERARAVRWEASPDGLGGLFRRRRSRHFFHAFGILWNLGIPQLSSRVSRWFVAAGIVAAAFFFYLMVRSVVGATYVRFEGGWFVCRSGPLPPRTSIRHLVADIGWFVVERGPTPKDDEWKFSLVTRSGNRIELPIDVDGFVMVWRGTRKSAFGRATPEEVAFVVDQLNEALDRSRREASQYRSATPDPAPERGDE
jgi:hypothetical protein